MKLSDTTILTRETFKRQEQTILTHILSIEHRQRGLTLGEDEDCVYLMKNGNLVATFPISKENPTVTAIYQEADKWCSGGDAISELVSSGCIAFGRG